jgi:hypothetical protein
VSSTLSSKGLWIPGRDHKAIDRVAHRIEHQAAHSQDEGDPDLPRDPWEPRWTINQKWIEFECGCRAERCEELHCKPIPGDAIIFAGLPEQAVYDQVCHRHGPGMNKYIRFTGTVTFDQWKLHRRHLLMGKR